MERLNIEGNGENEGKQLPQLVNGSLNLKEED